jgi:hypothetical protein
MKLTEKPYRIEENIPGKAYQSLYSRYLKKRPAKDWELKIEGAKGKKILDIGGGTGELSTYMKSQGAEEVVLLDKTSSMVSAMCPDLPGYVYSVPMLYKNGVVIDFFNIKDGAPDHKKRYKDYFDVAIACQSINFWLDKNSAKLAAHYIKDGGFLVFNTFNTRPPETPIAIEYQDDEGKNYSEISYIPEPNPESGFEQVFHVQMKEGERPHICSFNWISPEKFREFLEPHFRAVTELQEGRTSFYFCLK